LLSEHDGVVYLVVHTVTTRGGTVKQQPARKPFVAPKLSEEASLEDVTLQSLGTPVRNNSVTNENLAARAAKGGRTA
jgi:hypothetical protein